MFEQTTRAILARTAGHDGMIGEHGVKLQHIMDRLEELRLAVDSSNRGPAALPTEVLRALDAGDCFKNLS